MRVRRGGRQRRRVCAGTQVQELQREFGEFDRTIAILQNDIKVRPYAVQLYGFARARVCVCVHDCVRACTFSCVHLFVRVDCGLSL